MQVGLQPSSVVACYEEKLGGRGLSSRRRKPKGRKRQSGKARSTARGASGEKRSEARQPPADLPSLVVGLHGVLDAIAANVDGLSRQWAQRFDPADYSTAMASDREVLASFLGPIQKAVQLQDDVANAAGKTSVVSEFPVPLAEMTNWSSSAPAEHLWRYQSIAVLSATQDYISALEALGQPGRIEFQQGRRINVELEPMRAAALQQRGRLLAEVVEEAAATLAELADVPPLELGVAPEPDGPYQQLVRSYRLAHLLGSPEASLLHLIRYLSQREAAVHERHSGLIEDGKSELLRYLSGEPVSRGVALMLADALARVVDECQRSDATESQGARFDDESGYAAEEVRHSE